MVTTSLIFHCCRTKFLKFAVLVQKFITYFPPTLLAGNSARDISAWCLWWTAQTYKQLLSIYISASFTLVARKPLGPRSFGPKTRAWPRWQAIFETLFIDLCCVHSMYAVISLLKYCSSSHNSPFLFMYLQHLGQREGINGRGEQIRPATQIILKKTSVIDGPNPHAALSKPTLLDEEVCIGNIWFYYEPAACPYSLRACAIYSYNDDWLFVVSSSKCQGPI